MNASPVSAARPSAAPVEIRGPTVVDPGAAETVAAQTLAAQAEPAPGEAARPLRYPWLSRLTAQMEQAPGATRAAFARSAELGDHLNASA